LFQNKKSGFFAERKGKKGEKKRLDIGEKREKGAGQRPGRTCPVPHSPRKGEGKVCFLNSAGKRPAGKRAPSVAGGREAYSREGEGREAK